MSYDVVIAGGGPAGLGAGIFGRLAGLSVLVVEPRPGVIDKACGEGLMPPAVALLEEMGVRIPPGRPFRGIRYVAGERAAEGLFPRRAGMGIRRTALHDALLDRAEALGVHRAVGRVQEVAQGESAVRVTLQTSRGPRTVRAPWLVAADGLHSPLRRSLRLERPARFPQRYGVRRHFRVAPWTDLVEVHWGNDVEAYVTPVAEDEVGVALLFSGRARPDELLWRLPALAERMGEPSSDWMGAGPFEQRAARRVSGRVLLVGDAAGFLDPITGEGVRLALASARAAIACIVRKTPEAYERAWRQETWRYWALTTLLLRIDATPWLRPRLVPVLRAAPWLFDLGLCFLTC